jgi:hypothetical protein
MNPMPATDIHSSSKTTAMNLNPMLAALTLASAFALTSASSALAGDGHDHGEAPRSAAGPAQPRFAVESELFELVGVLSGKQLTLYLDRSADNSPVREAHIELEIGGIKYPATARGDAEFEVVLPEAPKPGVIPLVATVTVGKESDLLAGELDTREPASAHADDHEHGWREIAKWVGATLAAIAALLGVAWGVRRLAGSGRANSRGAV